MSQAELLAPSPVVPSFPPLSYQGVPVLTTEMLAQAYEVEPYQIRQNFRNNRERFVEGKHFFIITSGELKEFRLQVESFYSQISPKVRALTLWTERGAARNAKMLDSDRAWDVFELLEETFFRVVRPDPSPTPEDIPGTVSPLSKRTDPERKQLTAIINTWVGMAPIHYASARAQVNAHFGVTGVDKLTVEQVKEAIRWVQAKIDALPAPAPAAALPSSPASPDEVEMHFAAIREHIRQIHRHEEALFLLARKALPSIRTAQDMYSPARRMGLNALQSMEDCSGALDYSLRALESAARAMLALGR